MAASIKGINSFKRVNYYPKKNNKDTVKTKDALNLFDKNGDGKVSTDELKALSANGQNISAMDLYKINHQLFSEYYNGICYMPNPYEMEKEVVSIADFSKALDADGNGKIDIKDFNKMAKSDKMSGLSIADFGSVTNRLNFKQTETEIDKAFKAGDENADGHIGEKTWYGFDEIADEFKRPSTATEQVILDNLFKLSNANTTSGSIYEMSDYGIALAGEDGKISKEELKSLDTNKDGKISQDEIQVYKLNQDNRVYTTPKLNFTKIAKWYASAGVLNFGKFPMRKVSKI